MKDLSTERKEGTAEERERGRMVGETQIDSVLTWLEEWNAALEILKMESQIWLNCRTY